MITIPEMRAKTAIDLDRFRNDLNYSDCVKELKLDVPKDRVYILRMLIRRMFGELKLPNELNWVKPIIEIADEYQKNQIGVTQPFLYLTIRSGLVTSTTDDEWHVDGFSMNITHLPEQNYIWSDSYPTQVIEDQYFNIPDDFDPKKHNLHKMLAKQVEQDKICELDINTVYCLDPYVVHRRQPNIPIGHKRCFVRLSYTPIEIEDVNNTINSLLPTNYIRDGKKEFRDLLGEY